MNDRITPSATPTPRAPTAKPKVDQRDLPLLNDLQAALQHEKHTGMTWAVWLITALLVSFVLWAYFSQVEEVTRGQGTVIPSGHEQDIQSLDPGVMAALLVNEGDFVDKGQTLLRLDTTRSSAVYRESKNKVDALRATSARLRAEAYGVPLVFDPSVPDQLAQQERAAFQNRTRAVTDAVAGMKQSKALLDREISITEPMVAKGAVSEVEVLRMKRQASDLAIQIAERTNRFRSDANTELLRVESELAQSAESMAARADPVARSEIKSPVRGIVKRIKTDTIGGVINAGQEIMTIVPLDGPLIVEAYIRPADVAFIRPNAHAVVKLTAYDYAIYGGLDGTVTMISPDTLQDSRRAGELKLNPDETFYRILVQTKDSQLKDKNGKVLPVLPGMVASVDIKTGEKSVFQYLVKPITRLKQALRER